MTVKVKFTVESADLMADGPDSPLVDWDNEGRIYEMAVMPRVGEVVTISLRDRESEPDVDFTVTDVHHFICDGRHEFTYLTVKKWRLEDRRRKG
jgi:hypothetical protein